MTSQPLTSHDHRRVIPASASTAGVLGRVMFLVALAIGFLALGAVLGRDLAEGTAIVLSFGGVGMLFVQALGGSRFRVGSFALGWLFAVGLVLGLGLGPVLSHYAEADPAAIIQAAGATALIAAVMGAGGLAIDRDLTGWLRPLSWIVFGLLLATLVALLTGTGGNPLLSLAIAAISAVSILVDFNLLRRQGTDADVVVLATGIFVSVVNIFVSLLNVFTDD